MTRKEWWLRQIEGYSLTDKVVFEYKWLNRKDEPTTMFEFEQWIKKQPDEPRIVDEYYEEWRKFSIEPLSDGSWLIATY